VQGLGDLNKKADQFLSVNGTDQALRGAALIGHQVEVPGGSLSLGADGSAIASATASDKGPVNVVVQDSAGNPVRGLTLADGGAGPRRIEWDGKDAAGNRLPAGDYRFSATQAGADGKPVSLETYGNAKVESVSLDKDGATLNLAGGQTVPLAKVLRIS
jgi:flagellar basal-body rod modification protein FlgD